MGLFAQVNSRMDEAECDVSEPPSLAIVPDECAAVARDIAIAQDLENSLDEIWAALRSRQLHDTEAKGQLFALAHWEPHEGATTLAATLAYRAAQADPASTFCLVDFDLFNSALSFLTELDAELGVSNVLLGQATFEESLAATCLENLTIIPAGYPSVGRHVAQLHDRCQELCEILAEQFDYVLLDIPCLRRHPNFAFWASGLSQAVLVARSGQARRPTIAKAIATLKLMRLDVAGIILNAREYHGPAWLHSRA